MSNERTAPLPYPEPMDRSKLPVCLTGVVWFGWLAAVALLISHAAGGLGRIETTFVVVDGLTLVMWVAIGFFSGIVHSFTYRYLTGASRRLVFYGNIFGFTVSACIFVAANFFGLVLASWFAMGWFIARLIGHAKQWPQARNAVRAVQNRFLVSSALLAAGLSLMTSTPLTTESMTITGAMAQVKLCDPTLLGFSALALIFAAALQGALVPMHRWLFSSMTAPTPASALMHAGFVNGGAVLLARFAPLIGIDRNLLMLLLVLGAISAIAGKVLKATQPQIKRQLGCSTIGQMGFMMMQIGLGFYSAAITHLILHGCYKAYLFLGAGERVTHLPPKSDPKPHPPHVWISVLSGLIIGLLGAGWFAFLTGEGQSFDTGLLLAFFVALTVFHATRDVVQNAALPRLVRWLGVPVIFLILITLYGAIFNAITALVTTLPAVNTPMPLTALHWIVGGLFLVIYIVVELDLHQKVVWLYPQLLNLAQPLERTLMPYKRDYHA